ncbi:hypothetical protein [Thiohalomonas denitrificans]|uniref:hypothetical protein n=1 Tax=Thiohalomonas denitrificans TaxID=415747 RepID=UPI0026F22BD6|nr:hypothetical protein [Thiohalomonas denitrificans]
MGIQAESADKRVLELFVGAVREVGGLRRLVTERRLGWLPELLASSEVLVLQEEEHRRLEEIAELLGMSRDTVANILAAPADRAEQCIEMPPPQAIEDRELAAGGLVRRAWSTR